MSAVSKHTPDYVRLSRMAGAIGRSGLALAALAGVVAFYFWTAGWSRAAMSHWGLRQDYYNLLGHGLLDGHLSMKIEPDPALRVELPNRIVSPNASYPLDASYYHGKFYLYFGVTPALTFFLPWICLMGNDPPEWFAAALLASAICLLGLAWLALLRREFFPRAGGAAWLAMVIAFGLGSGLPVVLRRPLFYEIAILSGCLWMIACLLCLTLALVRRQRAVRWLGMASACAGLVAGSRPTLIPGALAALALVAAWVWRRGKSGETKAWRLGLAALAPVGACLAGLAWYNWARFDNPLEFGLHHQLGSNSGGFPFTLASLWQNLRLYYLTPPDTGWYFPYFAPGPKPVGSYAEQVHGQFYFLPLLALAIAAGAWAWRRRALPAGLTPVVAATSVCAGVSLVIVALAPVHSNRYQLDFHPLLVVLALLPVLACAAASRPGARWLGRVAVAWFAVVAVFNVFISFHVHGFFRDSNLPAYAAIGRVCDRLVWPVQRLTHPVLGGVELDVEFPEGKAGQWEPLLEAGGGPEIDALLVRYTAPGRGRLVFDHQGFGDVEGVDFDLQPGRARRLRLRLGTLCPPEWHPWHETQPPASARQCTRVAAWLDGVEVLARDAVCFQGSPNQIVLGRRRGLRIGAERFSGRVNLARALEPDYAWLDEVTKARGPVRLRVLLPRDRFGLHEPLLVTGASGQADLLRIAYLREGLIQLTMHHEGWTELPSSPPIAVDYGQPHEFVIELGSLPSMAAPAEAGRTRGVRVWLDRHTVLTERFITHPAKAWQVYTGCTPWFFSTRRLFGGQILAVSRAHDDTAQAREALASGRPVEFRLTFPNDRPNVSEPLLTTGVSGRGDGLYMRYIGNEAVSFGLDHWGFGGKVSRPVRVDFDAVHRLVVSYGAPLSPTHATRGRVCLVLDGEVVLDEPAEFYPTLPSQVTVGLNPIGLSTSQPAFMGEIYDLAPSTR